MNTTPKADKSINTSAAKRFLSVGLVACLISGLGSAQSQTTPTGFMAAPGDAQVTLSWDRVPNASAYRIRRSGVTAPIDITVAASEAPRPSLVATNLRNEFTYTYSVRAVADGFESAPSASLRVVPSAPVLDLLPAGAKIEKLAGGFVFTEGPVWFPDDDGFLIFSDQDPGRVPGWEMWRWKLGLGVSSFRRPSNRTNGNTRDREGRLISCQVSTRSVTRTEPDGTITTLVTEYNGTKFNEPNDVVVKSDGTIWFTDPLYVNSQTQPGKYLYRFDPNVGDASVTVMARDMRDPNGICFSPDESRLYVSDAGPGNQVRVYDVLADNTLGPSRRFAPHWADGMRVDAKGRLFTTGAGVMIYSADGKLLGSFDASSIPEQSANICFGGENQEMLFVCASAGLYGITRMPDLIVTSITSTSLVEEQPTLLRVVVKNQGTGPTQAGTLLRVAMGIDGSTNLVMATGFDDSIPPGASVVLTADTRAIGATWTPSAGVHTIRAFLDPADLVRESIELNNASTNRLTVVARPADSDGDGIDDSGELAAGTDPADAASVLRILSVELGVGGSLVVTWSSAPGKTYRIARTPSLVDVGWAESSEVITADGPTTSGTIKVAPLDGSTGFLRVRAEP